MKIKNIATTIATLMLGASVGISAFAFAGCKDPEKNPGDDPTIENPDIPDNPDKPGKPDDIIDPSKAKITVTADKKEIIAGSDGKITMTVTIEDFPIKTVIWTTLRRALSRRRKVSILRSTLTSPSPQRARLQAKSKARRQ